jgi:hypothetical protein
VDVAIEWVGVHGRARRAASEGVDVFRQPERDEFIRMSNGKLSDQDGIDERVDRRIGADAESEATDDERRKGRVATNRAQRVAEVLPKFVNHEARQRDNSCRP